MHIGELRPTETPLRCAYCHATVDTVPVVCHGCGTRLHSECVENLSCCPTLGCKRILSRHEGAPPFPWIRSTFGLLLLVNVAVRLLTTHHHCADPGCMRAEIAASSYAMVLGLPGLWLAAPGMRRVLKGHILVFLYVGVAGLTLLSAAPVMLVSGGMNHMKTLSLEWFSYTLTWDSLGDGNLSLCFPSPYVLLIVLLVAHLSSRVFSRTGT